MSLRAFHLVFIALSVILAAFTATWAGAQFGTTHRPMFLVVTAAFLVTASGLGVYMAAFVRKTRNL